MLRLLTLITLLLAATQSLAADRLPRLNIAPDSLTVSGISSGGYMAVQYQVAYSKSIAGAGVIAGGPWFCAQDTLSKALGECLKAADRAPDTAALVTAARTAAREQRIDDVAGLAGDRVWLFHGSRDETVGRPVTDALADFYAAFMDRKQIRYETNVPAAHGFPTLDAGIACSTASEPWINDCDYDAAGALLQQLYGPLAEPSKTNGGKLIAFDQARYASATARSSLAPIGYAFVPAPCATGEQCRLHVAFHGCRQGTEVVGRAFVNDAGYNRWAASNRIIVLYPQAKKSLFMPMNPQGCWDWWGYTGPDYATRDAAQMSSVRQMIEALGLR